ncbi:serine/threonine-protein kinase [Streptomyces litchfieldiae]|uniref:non-specific serine/threonine protein kinase n=1 Tax=Streptomyces litchfieldiae TaxID=3075543 RepID=A0ABU2MK60_9ACTN|nr:serine/threonine-protein kinase [Streptomyces sp. DSM 44938]MDT0341987.1 serine/threonine-protein kinase [Streptomyces sp. DSM 44938]
MSAPVPDPDGADLRSFTGRTIDGRYELTEWIGGGVFGGVFRSEQRILGRPVRRVACKLSRRGGMTEAAARELFTDVLLLAGTMDGLTDAEARRHLVHVYDGGLAVDAGRRAYLVMEYVPGTTLAAQFRSLPRVPVGQMVTWARQICVALRGLHTLPTPLVHRDLKPDNVLLGTDLTVRLIDFGLAGRMVAAGYAAGVAGTLHYMAPETSRGQSLPASDLYSLGLLIYEGLTGRHPFGHLVPPPGLPDSLHGDWLHRQKQLVTPAPPSELNNTVSRAVDDLVLRLLRFDPERRFRNAGEVLDALAGARSGRPRPPAERAREEAAALLAEGDRRGARRVLERCLDAHPDLAPDARFAVLDQLADVLDALDDPARSADRLAAAWLLVKDSALLRTREERAALLARTEARYRRAGNTFQADQFAWLRRREQGRG